MKSRPLQILSVVFMIFVASVHAQQSPSLTFDDETASYVTGRIENGEYGTVTSLLLLSDGQTSFEYYAEGVDADTLHNTRSVTKTMTGMAFGALVADGQIDVDTALASYFADITPFENMDKRKLELTAEDLLTMSGPMECDDWNSFSRGNEERMYLIEHWSRFYWNLPIRGFPSWAPRTRSAPFERAFSYCSAGVQVIGEVVERVSGMPFTQFFEDRFLKPMGVSKYRWGYNGEGKPHLTGGFELTARGLAAFAELQRNEGSWQEQRLLPADWVRMSATAHTRVPDSDWEYGYLWWLRDYEFKGRKYRSASMTGNGGNRVLVIKELGLSLVVTKTDFNQSGMHQQTDALIDEIIRQLEAQNKRPPLLVRAF